MNHLELMRDLGVEDIELRAGRLRDTLRFSRGIRWEKHLPTICPILTTGPDSSALGRPDQFRGQPVPINDGSEGASDWRSIR
ncbi:MAG: hypothetical protein AB1733_19310 [Thermodesulfobacteriota bacterium]